MYYRGDVTGTLGTLGTWPGKLEKALVFTCFFEFFGKGTCFHVIFWNFFGLLARKIGKGTCPKCPKRVPKVPVTPPPPQGKLTLVKSFIHIYNIYSHTSIIRASIIRGPILYAVFKQEVGTPKYLNYTSNYLYFTRTSIHYYTRFLV